MKTPKMNCFETSWSYPPPPTHPPPPHKMSGLSPNGNPDTKEILLLNPDKDHYISNTCYGGLGFNLKVYKDLNFDDDVSKKYITVDELTKWINEHPQECPCGRFAHVAIHEYPKGFVREESDYDGMSTDTIRPPWEKMLEHALCITTGDENIQTLVDEVLQNGVCAFNTDAWDENRVWECKCGKHSGVHA
jgi:hypothetical protein